MAILRMNEKVKKVVDALGIPEGIKTTDIEIHITIPLDDAVRIEYSAEILGDEDQMQAIVGVIEEARGLPEDCGG